MANLIEAEKSVALNRILECAYDLATYPDEDFDEIPVNKKAF